MKTVRIRWPKGRGKGRRVLVRAEYPLQIAMPFIGGVNERLARDRRVAVNEGSGWRTMSVAVLEIFRGDNDDYIQTHITFNAP